MCVNKEYRDIEGSKSTQVKRGVHNRSEKLACSNLSQSLSGQSTEGGDSGIKTKSASDDKAVTVARYLHQKIVNYYKNILNDIQYYSCKLHTI